MNKNILRSIIAILAGFIVVTAASVGTDALFSNAGLLKDPFHDTTTGVILLIIIYRNIYNVAGCYLVAALAPNHPLGHTLIVGVIGCVLSLVATIALWEPVTGWYSITITILAIPSAWAGGKLREVYLRKSVERL